MISVGISLFVILGIVLGAGWLARRFRQGGWRGGGDAHIRVVASRAVGQNATLLIVEADGRRFLVGAGRQGLTAIGALGTVPGFTSALDHALRNDAEPPPA